MGGMLEVEVPQETFYRRIQPLTAPVEVSWRVKMFTHEGVVLAALYLEQSNLILAMALWPNVDPARRLFKGRFAICLYSAADPRRQARLVVRLDPDMVEEFFVAAELINPKPSKAGAKRAEKYFTEFLALDFPDSQVVWTRLCRWQDMPEYLEATTRIRVG